MVKLIDTAPTASIHMNHQNLPSSKTKISAIRIRNQRCSILRQRACISTFPCKVACRKRHFAKLTVSVTSQVIPTIYLTYLNRASASNRQDAHMHDSSGLSLARPNQSMRDVSDSSLWWLLRSSHVDYTRAQKTVPVPHKGCDCPSGVSCHR
jgi:hypothetical protein